MGTVVNPLDAIPTASSTSYEWVSFFKSLKTKLSKKDAQIMWLRFWSVRGGDIPANDSQLRAEMKELGITIQAGSVFGSIKDSSIDILGSVGDFFAIGKTAVVIGLAIPVCLIGVLGYRVFKSGIEASYNGAGIKV